MPGRFFYRILCSCLLTFLIPFATILLVFNIAQKNIREEILHSNTSSMYQFVNGVENLFSESKTLLYQVSANNAVTAYARTNRVEQPSYGMELYNVAQYLVSISIDTFSDLMIYFPKNNAVASKLYSSFSSYDYYKNYYANDFATHEEFCAFFSMPPTVAPVLKYYTDLSGQRKIVLMYARNTNNSFDSSRAGDIVAAIVFTEQQLHRIFSSVSFLAEDRIMVIFDKNQQIVTATQPISEDDLTLQINHSDSYYYDTVNNTEYVLQLYTSQHVDCTYTVAIPQSLFWQRLSTLRNTSYVSLGLCLVVSLLLLFGITKINYTPISDTMSEIMRHTNELPPADTRDEFGFITAMLQKTMERTGSLERELEQHSNPLQEGLLLHTLNGTVFEKGQTTAEVFAEVGLCFPSEVFCVLLFQIERIHGDKHTALESTQDMRVLDIAFRNVLPELCGEKHAGAVVSVSPSRYAALVNRAVEYSNTVFQKDLYDLCESFLQFMKKHFNTDITASYGNAQNGLKGIHASYTQALSAMEYRFFRGRGKIIPYADTTDNSFSYNSNSDSQAAQLMMEYVKSDGDTPPPVARLLTITAIDAHASIDTVLCYKYEMINILNKVSLAVQANAVLSETSYVERLTNADTLEAFQQTLSDVLQQLRMHCSSSESDNTLTAQAMQYIKRNFTDPNINNNSIANELHVSPGYLSRLFRARYNIAMIDFVYELRVERARDYLCNTDWTLDEISEKLGFSGSKTLIKIFKEKNGVTPGAYRKISKPMYTVEDDGE